MRFKKDAREGDMTPILYEKRNKLIHELHLDGFSKDQIGVMFNMSYHTVYRVIKGGGGNNV